MSDDQTPRPPDASEPGWYPHPSLLETEGYWDGERWTPQSRPLVPEPTPDAVVRAPLLLIGLGGVVALLGLLMAADGAALGIVFSIIGIPMIAVGVVAEGVRMGLAAHDASKLP